MNLTNLAVCPKANNRIRPKTPQKALIFNPPQKYPNMCTPPKIEHTKKTVKISQNNAKLYQERPKKLTKYLVFTHPKMAFYFWTRAFGVLQNRTESYKFSCFLKSIQPKKAKNLSKSINFYPPQKYPNICRPPKIGHTKKPLKSPKIMQNYIKNALKN